MSYAEAMALKATIYNATLEMVDLDRNYYDTHALTLACHPSETEDRLMVRLLAFALNAHERLTFGKGVSDMDEPDLWQKDLTDSIDLWIELGHPDEKIVARACGRARQVRVYTYSRSPELWWNPLKARFVGLKNLRVFRINPDSVTALTALVDRRMNLQCTIQDGDITFRDDHGAEVPVSVEAVPF